MTPDELAAPGTEHAMQRAYFCWCNQQTEDPRLKRCFAIPNGGERNKAVASRLKSEGVKSGVPDVFVPIPVGIYHGLYIEFKKPGREKHKNGGLSDEQSDWKEYFLSQNYGYFVAYSYGQAADTVVKYLRHSN